MENLINDSLDLSSSDNKSDNESDNEFANESNDWILILVKIKIVF